MTQTAESAQAGPWAQLPAASPGSSEEDPAAQFGAWLATQCRLLGQSVRLAALIRIPAAGEPELLERWPDLQADVSPLAPAWQRATSEACGIVLPLRGAGEANYAVAYPLQIEGQVVAVIALAIRASQEADLQHIMGHLEWGSGYLLALLMGRRLADRQAAGRTLNWSNALFAAVLAEADFSASAQRLVEELAAYLGCERVAFGIVDGRRVHLANLSQAVDFSSRHALVRQLEAAMCEAVDQAVTLSYPAPDTGTHIVMAQRELSEAQGHHALLTLPLLDYADAGSFAVLTLERKGTRPFSADERSLCEAVAALAGAALRDKWLNERPLWPRLWERLRREWRRLVGPGHPGRKLLATLALLLAGLALWPGEYRLASDSVLESADRRVIAAPFNGYIATARVRAGDLVEPDAELARLDDRELNLERARWHAQRAQLTQQMAEAQAKYDRAQMAILRPQIDQATAQISLAESQLERALLRAPFRGKVISGDLSQRIGDAVRTGDQLFVVASLEDYRLFLKVRENRILDVRPGQTGRLMLQTLPGEVMRFTVERVTPVLTTEAAGSSYRVEARLDRVDTRLRPGMSGVGKIDIDSRSLLGIWTRDLVEMAGLHLWRWWS